MNSYFEVETIEDRASWTSLAELAADPPTLRAKVAVTQAALGAAEARVAASIDLLGVAARVLSPVLRWAVVDSSMPVLDPHTTWWRPARPGPMRLALEVSNWQVASAENLHAGVLRTVVAPLVDAYATTFVVSRTVLWGNVASALNGAADTLRAGHPLVEDALSSGDLAGTARTPPPRFVRNSCCLFYRVPGTGVCGDCVLTAAGKHGAARG